MSHFGITRRLRELVRGAHDAKHEEIDALPAEERAAALLIDEAQHEENRRSSGGSSFGPIGDFVSDFQDDVLDPIGEGVQGAFDDTQNAAEDVVEEFGRIDDNLKEFRDRVQGLFERGFDIFKGITKGILALIIGIPVGIAILIIILIVRAGRRTSGA